MLDLLRSCTLPLLWRVTIQTKEWANFGGQLPVHLQGLPHLPFAYVFLIIARSTAHPTPRIYAVLERGYQP